MEIKVLSYAVRGNDRTDNSNLNPQQLYNLSQWGNWTKAFE